MPLKNSRSHETPLPIEEGVSSEEPALEQEGSFEVDAGREAGRQEQDRQGRQGEKEGTSGAIQAVPTTVPSDESAVQTKDPLTQQVEAILEEDLKEVYDKMSPEEQRAFQVEGERVAGTIRQMISSAKFTFRKVLKLIHGWLKMIPGVNKFFLLQEAKLKADRMELLAKEEDRKRRNHV